ncbi:MAG: hypothetical protein NXI32_11070 [bacterium]|nr:hypothetical protein [bacterium]
MAINYMICNESVVFTGSYEQCVEFLSARGIVHLPDLIEPFDQRVADNEFLLRFGSVRWNSKTRPEIPAVAATQSDEAIANANVRQGQSREK